MMNDITADYKICQPTKSRPARTTPTTIHRITEL